MKTTLGFLLLVFVSVHCHNQPYYDYPGANSYPNYQQHPRPAVLPCREMNFRLHRESNVCYQTESRGPCGENLVFVPRGEIYGYCVCKEKNSYYWETYDRCFLIHTQGPCQFGYYFTVDHMSKSYCRLNPCGIPVSVNGTVHNPVKWTDGKCYLEGTTGPCGKADQTYAFAGFNRPSCVVGNTAAAFYDSDSDAPVDDLLQIENAGKEPSTNPPAGFAGSAPVTEKPGTSALPVAHMPETVLICDPSIDPMCEDHYDPNMFY